jgi:hypothetical protein
MLSSSSNESPSAFALVIFAPGIAPSLAISVPRNLLWFQLLLLLPTFAVVSTASTDTSKAVTTLSAVVALPFAAATAASFATRAFSNTSSCASVSCTPLLPRTVEMVAIPSPSIPTNDWIAGKLLVVLTYFLF